MANYSNVTGSSKAYFYHSRFVVDYDDGLRVHAAMPETSTTYQPPQTRYATY